MLREQSRQQTVDNNYVDNRYHPCSCCLPISAAVHSVASASDSILANSSEHWAIMLKQIVIRGKDSDHSSVVFIYIFQQITNMAAKKYSQVYFELYVSFIKTGNLWKPFSH